MVRTPWPSQAGQRPSPVLNETRRPVAARARFERARRTACGSRPTCRCRWPGHERGVLPIGVWSTSSTRSIASVAGDRAAADPRRVLASGLGVAAGRGRARATAACRLVISTSRASVDLPEPLTPVTATSRGSGSSTVTLRRLCSVAPSMRSQSAGSPRTAAARVGRDALAARLRRMHDRIREETGRSATRAAPTGPPRCPARPPCRRACPRPARCR